MVASEIVAIALAASCAHSARAPRSAGALRALEHGLVRSTSPIRRTRSRGDRGSSRCRRRTAPGPSPVLRASASSAASSTRSKSWPLTPQMITIRSMSDSGPLASPRAREPYSQRITRSSPRRFRRRSLNRSSARRSQLAEALRRGSPRPTTVLRAPSAHTGCGRDTPCRLCNSERV